MPAIEKKPVLVVAPDFDGCLFNKAFYKKPTAQGFVEANQLLINHLVSQINAKDYERVVFLVGSNRQSKFVDDQNNKLRPLPLGSCFPALIDLCDVIQSQVKIPCVVDKYLLADTYGNQTPGENYERALARAKYNYSYFVWDELKASLIYGHINKVASDYPDQHIDYHFYDDRKDILTFLSNFYAKAENNCIPTTVNASFYQYLGKDPERMATIQGKGPLDHGYHHNLKVLSRCCGLDPMNPKRSYQVLSAFPKGISTRLNDATAKQFESQRLLSNTDLLKAIDDLIAELQNQLPEPPHDYQPFLIAVKMVVAELKQRLNNQPDARVSWHYAASDVFFLLTALKTPILDQKRELNIWRQSVLECYRDRYLLKPAYSTNQIAAIAHAVFGMFNEKNPLTLCTIDLAKQINPILAVDNLVYGQSVDMLTDNVARATI